MKPSTLEDSTTNLTMESLALPRDLYWDGKTEPTSPLSNELFSITETGNWFHNDNFANEITLVYDETIDYKPGLDYSEELVDGEALVVELYDLKTEHWNDTKLQSPTQLLEYPVGTIISHPNLITKVQSPYEFGLVNGTASIDNAILTQLTPPQSPPQTSGSPAFHTLSPLSESQINLNDVLHPTSNASATISIPTSAAEPLTTSIAIPIGNDNISSTAGQSLNFANWNTNNGVTPLNVEISDDIRRELQIVDEIVNTRAKELLDWNDEECETQSSFSAPSQAGSSTDEEWLPESLYSSSAGSSPVRSSGDEEQLNPLQSPALSPVTVGITSTPKKRTRPYGRGVEDRKIRKKEQNKNAATRYRQKKKLEMETVFTEEQKLTQRHEELKRILADRKREAKYLKTLIKEFYRKKQ